MSGQDSMILTLYRLEHLLSLFGGVALVLYGLALRSIGGLLLALLGGDLHYHGLARKNTHIHPVFALDIPQQPFAVMRTPRE